MDVLFDSFLPAGMRLTGGVQLDCFRVLRREDMTARVTGRIELAGRLRTPELRGQIRVDGATLRPQIGGRAVQRVGPQPDVIFGRRGDVVTETRVRGLSGGPVVELSVELPEGSTQVLNDISDLYLFGEVVVRVEDGKPR